MQARQLLQSNKTVVHKQPLKEFSGFMKAFVLYES